jgi:hypothetical protein
MGTWGTGPFDNDDAGDLAAKMVRPVQRVADGKGSCDDYYLARAAAQFLIVSHGTDILGGPGLVPVLWALARMRADDAWIGNWRSPRKIAAALDKELLDVLGRMRMCKGCRRSIKKPEWAELEILVATARSRPVPRSTSPKRKSRTEALRAARKKRNRGKR